MKRPVDFVAAHRQALADLGYPEPTYPAPRDVSPLAFEDEDTLRRLRGGLSRWARAEQRRPAPIKVDELGYDRQGRYYVAMDGAP